MAKFYVTWAVAVDDNVYSEEIEAESLEDAEAQTRVRFTSGLVDLTRAMSPKFADDVMSLAEVPLETQALMPLYIGEGLRESVVRVLVPSSQILKIYVATTPAASVPFGKEP